MLGEGGVVPAPAGYLAAAREHLYTDHDALLIIDEVQSGIGRTGEWFASTAAVQPDVMTLAKGLAGGLPARARVWPFGPAGDLLRPGDHGTTFGGNPVSCAAALAVLDTIESRRSVGQRHSRWGSARRRLRIRPDHPSWPGIAGSACGAALQLAGPVAACRRSARRATTATW